MNDNNNITMEKLNKLESNLKQLDYEYDIKNTTYYSTQYKRYNICKQYIITNRNNITDIMLKLIELEYSIELVDNNLSISVYIG